MAFKGFIARNPEDGGNFYGNLPAIDKKRVLAVYVRQSKTGADDVHGESRETQLKLVVYAKRLLGLSEGDETDLVRLYDEGAGQSGRKRIDERKELNRLYTDLSKGELGTVIVAREDRLFRDKHGHQSGLYSELAEAKGVLTIVPPIVTPYTSVYDMSNYEHLKKWKDKMQAAYDFIVYHIGYMIAMRQKKHERGEFVGAGLPPGLAIFKAGQSIGPQKPVVYKPWQEIMVRLAKRARELNWNWAQLNREVEALPYLFPDPSEEDLERYMFKTALKKVPGGYKPLSRSTIRNWFTRVVLIGWWVISEETGEVIKNNHEAVLERSLFEPAFSSVTGYNLDGEIVNSSRITAKRGYDTSPKALFHGRVSTPNPEGGTAMVRIDTTETDSGLRWAYYECTMRLANQMFATRLFSLSAEKLDAIIVDRLKILAGTDENIAEQIRRGMEEIREKQEGDIISIEDQLRTYSGQKDKLQKNIVKLGKLLEEDDEVLQELAEELKEVKAHIEQLEAKKKKLKVVDGGEEIEEFYSVLGNFEARYPELSLEKRQRLFAILVSHIEAAYLSPHWVRVTIHWLPALLARPDVMLLWRNHPRQSAPFTEDEDKIIRERYPTTLAIDVLKMLPSHSWSSIRHRAEALGVSRKTRVNAVPHKACWLDIAPDGENFLFGDKETSLKAIEEGTANTSRKLKPLYSFWLIDVATLEPKVEELNLSVQLAGGGQGLQSRADRNAARAGHPPWPRNGPGTLWL